MNMGIVKLAIVESGLVSRYMNLSQSSDGL